MIFSFIYDTYDISEKLISMIDDIFFYRLNMRICFSLLTICSCIENNSSGNALKAVCQQSVNALKTAQVLMLHIKFNPIQSIGA